MKLLLTAGGTREAVDAVRFIGNRSSGRMGAAVAAAAVKAGHDVTLILAAASVDPPAGVRVLRVETTGQMQVALEAEWPGHDALAMAAAVADYRPKVIADRKLRREGGPVTLELVPTPDLLAAAAGVKRQGQVVVGFSLDDDTAEARERAAAKLERKRLDLLVYNPVGTMEADDVAAELFFADGRREALGAMSKTAFAARLVVEVERLTSDKPRHVVPWLLGSGKLGR